MGERLKTGTGANMTNFKIAGRFSSLYTCIRRKETMVRGKDSDQWSVKIIFHKIFKLCYVGKAKG